MLFYRSDQKIKTVAWSNEDPYLKKLTLLNGAPCKFSKHPRSYGDTYIQTHSFHFIYEITWDGNAKQITCSTEKSLPFTKSSFLGYFKAIKRAVVNMGKDCLRVVRQHLRSYFNLKSTRSSHLVLVDLCRLAADREND